MLEWEEWSNSGGGNDDDFPKLDTLWIKDSPKLCENLPKVSPLLRDLIISECGELTAIIPGDASLQSLKLEGCKDVVFQDMTILSSLRLLDINFESMSNSFPNGMMEKCNNLEELRISHWSSLTHFPDDGLPATTLKKFKIEYCKNLEFLPKETFHRYIYLEKLSLVKSCDSMISFPVGLFPNLKKLKISRCDKLTNFESSGLLASSLRSIDIWECKGLESLPERMNNLEKLKILKCEKLESFPTCELSSNLQYLTIRGCKKMMAKRREWDLHTLVFLKSLRIEECEEIKTFPEEDWQLPTSIAYLHLKRLPELKRIDASRLLNLTSLDFLGIKDCLKVKFDPKLRNTRDLPTSFHWLRIFKCPDLAKQLRKMKRDIIPILDIDGEYIV